MSKFKYTIATVLFIGSFTLLLFPENQGSAIFASIIMIFFIGFVSGNENKELESKLVDRIIKLEDKVEATDVENRRLRSRIDEIDNTSS